MAGPDDELLKEARRRKQRALTDKQRFTPRINDIYRLVMPHRTQVDGTQPADVVDDIFDSTAPQALKDFTSDMLHTFTPISADWVSMKAAPEAVRNGLNERDLNAAVAEYQEFLFAEINRSNFHAAAREAYADLAIGTAALLIQDVHPARPIRCEAVPITQLIIERGPGGVIDGRFWTYKLRVDLIKPTWPQAKLSDQLKAEIRDKTDREVEITQCLWRDWKNVGTETWRYIVHTESEVLVNATFTGAGSCPLIVARWDVDSTTAWGTGPLYDALPDIKTVNKAVELVLKAGDKAIDPPTRYDDDGVIDPSRGIVPGTWIPSMPGSKIEPIESATRFDVSQLVLDELRHAIRRALFQDRPDQRGKTPPTATQWLDEAQETARRMGAPAGGLIDDWQKAIVRRFAYLLAKRGTLPKVELGGNLVSLDPVSPLIRSHEQEEARRVERWEAGAIQRLGPEQAGVMINLRAVEEYLAQRDGMPAHFVRSEAQIQQQMAQMAQVAASAGMVPGMGGKR